MSEKGTRSEKHKREREMRLRWHRHMQIMEENNDVREIDDMMLPGKDQDGDQEGDGGKACVRRGMQ